MAKAPELKPTGRPSGQDEKVANSHLSKGSNHKAPQDCWFILTTMMLEKGWTVAETTKATRTRCQGLTLPRAFVSE